MDPLPDDKRDRDRRVRRTHSAIVQGFNGLFFKRAYEAIGVADIIEEASVGRSTFYEHFRSKEDVLSQASAWVLDVLAGGVTGEVDGARMESLLGHVRENRKSARSLLGGPAGARLLQELAGMIETRLAAMFKERGATLIVPWRVAAAQAAETQLALMRVWLERTAPCGVGAMGEAMRRSARSAVEALVASG